MRDLTRYGHQGGAEYCPGYLDKHGQWNNGFNCPKWGGPDETYCCGHDGHFYCCDPPDSYEKLPASLQQQIPLVVGLTVGVLVLLTTLVFSMCYFCHCCWAYKRRKSVRNGLVVGHAESHLVNGRDMSFAVNYSACPHRPVHTEMMMPPPSYPTEAPPPYPGEATMPRLDKEPLQTLMECSPPPPSPPDQQSQGSTADSMPLQPCRGQTGQTLYYSGSMDHTQPSTSRTIWLRDCDQIHDKGYQQDAEESSPDSNPDYTTLRAVYYRNQYAHERVECDPPPCYTTG